MAPVIDSFPDDWEVITYDNGDGIVYRNLGSSCEIVATGMPDRMGYARHAAIEFASSELILTADDDVIVSDPQAIVDTFLDIHVCSDHGPMHLETSRSGHRVWTCGIEHSWGYTQGKPAIPDEIVVNLPHEFRPHYPDSAMLGFGACYHRSLPPAVFARFFAATGLTEDDPLFMRESDRTLTVLAPRVLVDIPKQDREFANDDNRLWKQPDHVEMRERMLTLARQVRDA